jgi:hypothetical protein
MEAHELERIRRSIVMLPPGHSAGALTREAALDLVREAIANREDAQRYKALVRQLRALVEGLPGVPDGP